MGPGGAFACPGDRSMKIIPTYNKEQIPWEQIADSLQGELTTEGRAGPAC